MLCFAFIAGLHVNGCRYFCGFAHSIACQSLFSYVDAGSCRDLNPDLAASNVTRWTVYTEEVPHPCVLIMDHLKLDPEPWKKTYANPSSIAKLRQSSKHSFKLKAAESTVALRIDHSMKPKDLENT